MQEIDVEKIVISETGALIVKRGKKLPWQKIYCCRGGDDVFCGDWCPCFGNVVHGRVLNLCHSFFVVENGKDNLIDLRASDDFIIGDDGENAMPPDKLLEYDCQ